jgi:putative membrane protein
MTLIKELFNRNRILLFLKGMAMGAADSVPGISGGTIAFISGIYEELIDSIKSINLHALKTLFRQGVPTAWRYVNGNFLFTLLAGILVSIYLFANTVGFLLENFPRFLLSFFVGLILASIWLMMRDIKEWDTSSLLLLLLGSLLSIGLAFIPVNTAEVNLFYIFFCGSLAICAMILPGISGAYILILLGVYESVLTAVTEFEILILSVFLLGCASGLIIFSNALSYLFSRFREKTLSTLLGVLAGSLYTIWPGRVELTESSKSENHLLICFILALIGFFLVYGLERLAGRRE